MINGPEFVVNQTTIGDLIVTVMDAAMATVDDEEIAAEIASHVVVSILEKASPGIAQEILLALGDHELH